MIDKVIKQIKEASPESVSELFPRRYKLPDWAHNPEALSVSFLAHNKANRLLSRKVGDLTNDMRWVQAGVNFKKMGSRVYVIAPPLLKALLRTNYAENFDLSELHWPLPAFCLTLPRGGLKVAEDGDVTSILVNRVSEDTGDDLLVTATLESGADYSIKEPIRGFDLKEIMTTDALTVDSLLDEQGVNELKNAGILNPDYDIDMASDPQVCSRDLKVILEMALKCLTFMNACPDNIAEGTYSGKIKAKKGKGSALQRRPIWTPWILGETYVKKGSQSKVYDSTGKRISNHWRAGHFRQQPYGKDRAKRKTVWIEPYEVNNQQ